MLQLLPHCLTRVFPQAGNPKYLVCLISESLNPGLYTLRQISLTWWAFTKWLCKDRNTHCPSDRVSLAAEARRVPDGGVEDRLGLQEGPRWGCGERVAHICFLMPNTQKILYQLRQEAFRKVVLFSEMWKCVH